MSSFRTGIIVSAFLALMVVLAPIHARAEGPDNLRLNEGLARLSEILGSIHHLRDICGANDGPLWRNKMIDMINAADLDAEKRQTLITHFNDAYYASKTRYPTCTGDAAKRANALFDEAHGLAARLSDGRKSAASLF